MVELVVAESGETELCLRRDRQSLPTIPKDNRRDQDVPTRCLGRSPVDIRGISSGPRMGIQMREVSPGVLFLRYAGGAQRDLVHVSSAVCIAGSKAGNDVRREIQSN
jgi:hypothetical protein